METLASAAGERVFDVTAGDVALAKNFDIFAAAGGAGKVTTITGTVQHRRRRNPGANKPGFYIEQGRRKIQHGRDQKRGGRVSHRFQGFGIGGQFFRRCQARSGNQRARRSGVILSHPLKERINDLIRRMSLAEKVAQLQGGQTPAPAIPRLGLPSYAYWNEALHGVANNGAATVFPEPVGRLPRGIRN